MSRDNMTTVVDFRTDTSEPSEPSRDTEAPSTPTSSSDATEPTEAGWRPAIPRYLVVLLLGLCLLVVGLVLRATPPV
jgi:hypothetical protein